MDANTYTTDEAREIGRTIHAQLGGGMFNVMVGAKDFTFSRDGSLSFRIGRNGKGVNHVTVTLDPSDTYTMTFRSIRGLKVTEKAVRSMVYCDQLRAIFTAETGLFTSLAG